MKNIIYIIRHKSQNIFLKYKDKKVHILISIITSLFLVGMTVSCGDPEIIQFTLPTTIDKKINLSEIPSKSTIAPITGNIGALNTTPRKEKHTYTVYRLPSSDTASTLALTLTLDLYKEYTLSEKTFMLVTSNISTTGRTMDSILPPIKRLSGAVLNPPPQVISPGPRSQQNTNAALFANAPSPSYETLIEYNDGITNTPSTRTFKFERSNASSSTKNTPYSTKLYEKHEAVIGGRTIRVLFWVQEEELNTHSGSLRTDGKEQKDSKKVLNKLADEFLKPNGIYQQMYSINGGHIWDHKLPGHIVAAPKDPTEIHVGIGKIQNASQSDKEDILQGFVNPEVSFRDASQLFLSGVVEEPYYAPTVYLNIALLDKWNILSNSKHTFDLYSTFVHELQHIAAFSQQTLQEPRYSSDGRLILYNGHSWYNELFAVSIEHILGHTLLTAAGSTTPTSDLFELRGRPYYERLIKNEIITKYGLTPPDGEVVAEVYEFYRVFSMYLFGNYGIDVLRHVMSSSIVDDTKETDVIFEAIETTPLYQSIDKNIRPANFSQVVNDFYTSILLSSRAFLGNGTPVPNSTLIFFAPKSVSDVHIDDDDLARYGLSVLPSQIDVLTKNYHAMTFNLINAISNNSRDPRPVSNGIAPTDDLWTQGHGPLIDTPTTARMIQLNHSKGRFIYLGGKINDDNEWRNLAFTTNADDGTLQIKLNLPPGVVTSLVVVEDFLTP